MVRGTLVRGRCATGNTAQEIGVLIRHVMAGAIGRLGRAGCGNWCVGVVRGEGGGEGRRQSMRGDREIDREMDRERQARGVRRLAVSRWEWLTRRNARSQGSEVLLSLW